jgi:hypothetical protein
MKDNSQQYRYCGRHFSGAELEQIREIIASDERLNRVKISRRVCELFGWYKPDGGVKEMSCRVALLRMERDGLIRLPPPQRATAIVLPEFASAVPRIRSPRCVLGPAPWDPCGLR